MNILSLRGNPEQAARFIAYFQSRWASAGSLEVYRDCMEACLHSAAPLPQWYLLEDGGRTVGGAGLITNDFISRMDLWPWLCALYIEEGYRGHAYGALLIEHCKAEAARLGFGALYLCTDHTGYYEHYGFRYLAQGYHPWGESSRIYAAPL